VRYNFFKVFQLNYGVLKCFLDDGDNFFFKKVVSSILGGFVVHMNKNGAIIKVNRLKSKKGINLLKF